LRTEGLICTLPRRTAPPKHNQAIPSLWYNFGHGGRMKHIGLDAGSVSVKLAVLDENGKRLSTVYQRHKGHPLPIAFEQLSAVMRDEQQANLSLSVTGSAGKLIASILGVKPVNEIVAQSYSTCKLYPHIRTVFEMGGEDSKLILLRDEGKSVQDFSMNSVCAAGTGSFLDQQAERLRLTIEEFSEFAQKANKPSRIAGRCSVFAKSDMIHLQQIATPMEDVVAGLCFAVARNFRGTIARGREVLPPVSFQGGVAANQGMARAFREIFGLDELFVPEEYALMGAIGAALKNMDLGIVQNFDIAKLADFIKTEQPSEKGHAPLSDSPWCSQQTIFSHYAADKAPSSENAWSHPSSTESARELTLLNSGKIRIGAYLGIDIGSISTNLAVIDNNGNLLSKRYIMTAGRPIDAVNQGLAEVGEEIGNAVEILGVGTTGSGRYMIADYVGADIVKNEITAHATAASFIDRQVDTIFEIGGQDSKYISLKDGMVVDFAMNKACAAGTGSFLEEQAEKLNISIKGEFEQSAISSLNPCRLGERCTVFMENSLMANLQKGIPKNDLLAGLSYSIVQNYINRVVSGKTVGRKIFFQGGVAFNRAVVSAFRKYLGRDITVPPHHEVAGAIGMALIAMRHRQKQELEFRDKHSESLPPATAFKGFELSRKTCAISSFECRGCPNVCEVNRVKISGEDGYLFFGGRCEKYEKKQKKDVASEMPDLFSLRHELLRQSMDPKPESPNTKRIETRSRHGNPRTSDVRIGIPYIFFFHDFLPFWTTLLQELGFTVEVSPGTNRQIVNLGIENVLSEACFPIKVAHGHIKYLIDRQVDAILIPSFINMNTRGAAYNRGLSCPYVQTIPYVSRIAFDGIRMLTPLINLGLGQKFLEKELKRVLGGFRIGAGAISAAISVAEQEQSAFISQVQSKGREILSKTKERTIVIIGRSYNALDSGVNLEIPKKLAELGVQSIPMDFLPLDETSILGDWPNMYWRSGQRILQAARLIQRHPHLYAIYIGNFSCGPDSFILKYFDEEMQGKPYLYLEIDEHSAAAGAVTRCEAFLDSIDNKAACDAGKTQSSSMEKAVRQPEPAKLHPSHRIYIPRMSDHTFAVAAAFEHCGISAEVLPQSDSKSVETGKKYVSGKECYPCTVTTGDMIKKIMSPDFIPQRSAFFMPSGTGPCRFGQYNVFHRIILKELGLNEVPVFSPTQDTTFYSDLGIVGKDFSMHAWKGIIAYELLGKCLHETRPYERYRGAADELHKQYHEKLYNTLRNNNQSLNGILGSIRRDFENLPVHRESKPLIGVIGEIFVRSHVFSNENLIRRVEALGGEAWLAPVEEWVYYVNLMGLKKALLKFDRSAIISFVLKRFFQKNIEHKYAKNFRGFLKTLREPETGEILKKASPYLHQSFEGEAILSIGKALDLIERGASGIINAMPFGCMPGTIVTALLRGVSRDFGIPCLNIQYDGTESPAVEIQLEAFMDQAIEYKEENRNTKNRI